MKTIRYCVKCGIYVVDMDQVQHYIRFTRSIVHKARVRIRAGEQSIATARFIPASILRAVEGSDESAPLVAVALSPR